MGLRKESNLPQHQRLQRHQQLQQIDQKSIRNVHQYPIAAATTTRERIVSSNRPTSSSNEFQYWVHYSLRSLWANASRHWWILYICLHSSRQLPMMHCVLDGVAIFMRKFISSHPLLSDQWQQHYWCTYILFTVLGANNNNNYLHADGSMESVASCNFSPYPSYSDIGKRIVYGSSCPHWCCAVHPTPLPPIAPPVSPAPAPPSSPSRPWNTPYVEPPTKCYMSH